MGSEAITPFTAGDVEALQAPMPTLMEQYFDKEVTFKGVTAPLGALINLCPVPAEQRDAVKMEEYAGNILTESGVDWRAERGLPPVAEDSKKK